MIVTSATQGVGPRVAEALVDAGARLLLVGGSGEPLRGLAERLGRGGHSVEAVHCDMASAGDRRNLPRRAENAFGPVDVLVNNTGHEPIREFQRHPVEALQELLAADLLAPMLVSRELLPGMLERGRGHIVSIASLAGLLGLPYAAAYAASRAALIQWSISLNAELAGSGVYASAICPGFVAGAGLLAGSRSRPPRVFGLIHPDRVAAAVLAVLRRPRPQHVISQWPALPWIFLRALSPNLTARLANLLGLHEYLQELAKEQRRLSREEGRS